MAFSFLKPGKFFIGLSTVAVLASLALIVYPGPKLSIEFTGGTLMEVVMPAEATTTALADAIKSAQLTPKIDAVAVARTKEGTAIIRLRGLSNDEHNALIAYLDTQFGKIEERQFTTIGPTVGESLKRSAVTATIVACIAVALYVAFAFRSVPRKLSPWRFGVITVIALVHDVLITLGVFIILGKFTTFEIDTLFISALLTTLGYSVNDTIVIFDRIRENVINQGKHEDFYHLVDRSLRETFTRSFNTGLATLFMLLALYFLGSSTIQWFLLALIVGISVGTYSSLFLAAPLLVFWKKRG